ncbi:class I SAM-dependent methyltransferase [Patescibacteria group bacterium]|nr:class I SAM-dependent methyltransferase [Patescibacteria group bacterium]
MTTPQISRKYYSESDRYLRKLQSHDQKHFALYLKTIQKYLPPGSNLLEAGCGVGQTCTLLNNMGYNVTGIDISNLFISKAQNKGSINYHVADCTELPFENNSFDCVCSKDLIEHLCQPEIFLQESKRVLKNNGLLVIFAPNLISPIRPFVYNLIGKELSFKKSIPYFLKITLQRLVSRKPNFSFKEPNCDDEDSEAGGDNDAVFLANPLDLKFWLRENGFKLLQQSQGLTNGLYIIRNFLPGIRLVARKINNYA